jgi:hypothetical protein
VTFADPSGLQGKQPLKCPPTDKQKESGEARNIGDVDKDGLDDYEYPDELKGTGYKVVCHSTIGNFYVMKGDLYIHRCPYLDGENGWDVDKDGNYVGVSVRTQADDPEPGTHIRYDYKDGQLIIRLYDGDKVIGSQVINDPNKHDERQELPYPHDLARPRPPSTQPGATTGPEGD